MAEFKEGDRVCHVQIPALGQGTVKSVGLPQVSTTLPLLYDPDEEAYMVQWDGKEGDEIVHGHELRLAPTGA